MQLLYYRKYSIMRLKIITTILGMIVRSFIMVAKIRSKNHFINVLQILISEDFIFMKSERFIITDTIFFYY